MEPHPHMEIEDAQVSKAVVAANVIDPMPQPKPTGQSQILAPMQRIGVPGYAITGGYVLPREVDRRLTQRERHRLFEENVVSCSIVATCVRNFLDLVAGAEWNFEPADDSAEAEEVAEFVQDVLMNDMETPWGQVMRRQATHKFYGFSVQEWTLKAIKEGRWAGRLGFANIVPRPYYTIERFDIDPDSGDVKGFWQTNPNNGQIIYLPRERVVYAVDDTLSDSPEGVGLFRHLIRGAAGIARFEDLEHWGFETDLQGIPVGRAPLAAMQALVDEGTMTPAAAAQARFVIDNFITNHIRGPKLGITLDSATYKTTDDKQAPSNQRLWDVELLKSGGTSHAEINEAIKRKTQELARVLGGEHLLLGSEGGGSLALSQSSTKRLHGMVNSCLHELKGVSGKQIIKPLMLRNSIPPNLWPKAKPEEVAHRTIEEVTGALLHLSQAGVPLMPGDPAVDEVRDMVGLSRSDPKMADIQRIEAGLQMMIAGTAVGAGNDNGGGEEDGDEPPARGSGGARRARGAKPQPGGGDLTASLNQLRDYLSSASA